MPVLSEHPFFKKLGETCPRLMHQVCQYAVCRLQISKGDILFAPGETTQVPCMFFSTGGQMRYKHTSGAKEKVGPYQWISEGAIWVPWVFCGLMAAKEECSLYQLNAYELQKAVMMFPNDVEFVLAYG